MFSNGSRLVLVMLILSQIFYNMVHLECSFKYVDLVLSSFKGSLFPLIALIYFVLLVVSLLQGYQLSLVLLSSLEDIYYLAFVLMYLS